MIRFLQTLSSTATVVAAAILTVGFQRHARNGSCHSWGKTLHVQAHVFVCMCVSTAAQNGCGQIWTIINIGFIANSFWILFIMIIIRSRQSNDQSLIDGQTPSKLIMAHPIIRESCWASTETSPAATTARVSPHQFRIVPFLGSGLYQSLATGSCPISLRAEAGPPEGSEAQNFRVLLDILLEFAWQTGHPTTIWEALALLDTRCTLKAVAGFPKRNMCWPSGTAGHTMTCTEGVTPSILHQYSSLLRPCALPGQTELF